MRVQQVTVAGLARAAGVARSSIYTQPDLIENIRSIDNARPRPLARREEPNPVTLPGLKELTYDNTQLRKQLAHAHGQLRAKRATPSKTLSTTQNA